ncbi:hypothetical protein AB0F17_43310 [Nonomuraea sp. NPDC026600]|uniref:hypothetical protein n=1 Tax=Nonomuraea sp. NPDC026600 TaxID=3155363 RepID=UPI0033F8FA88
MPVGPAQTPPPPSGAKVTQTPNPGRTWRCLVPRCPLKGRPQKADTERGALDGFNEHYDYFHYTPPTAAAPDRSAP